MINVWHSLLSCILLFLFGVQSNPNLTSVLYWSLELNIIFNINPTSDQCRSLHAVPADGNILKFTLMGKTDVNCRKIFITIRKTTGIFKKN